MQRDQTWKGEETSYSSSKAATTPLYSISTSLSIPCLSKKVQKVRLTASKIIMKEGQAVWDIFKEYSL